MDLLVIAILASYLIYRELIWHFKEIDHTSQVKDLLDRIMAKSFEEYKANIPEPEVVEKKEPESTVDIEEAEEELND